MATGGRVAVTAGSAARPGPSRPSCAFFHYLIINQQTSTTLYNYDANGNMEDIDGLVCAWDFRDRLVVVENDTMRAQYATITQAVG